MKKVHDVNDREYWGSKITVKYGKDKQYFGVFYTKSFEFAKFMKRVCENSNLEAKVEPFYKKEK